MPKIRYTKGPEQLSLGALALTLGEWSDPVSDELAEQAMLPERVEMFGFETDANLFEKE